MSREIKFRAWSEEDREYRTDCNLTGLFNSVTGTPATIYSDEGDRFDIEQYTGLKDKNGKEIYEGDIVEVFSTDEYEIDFEGVYRVYFDNYWLSYQMYKIKSPYTKITFEPEMYDNIEVIGNIHENPELLGGKK